MVDERFELLSLVFRLAGHEEYNHTYTEYQKKLSADFEGFKEHAAVKFAAGLPLGYDAVFKFAVHIEKDGGCFKFIEDINSLVEDGRWNKTSAGEFFILLNDFYTETSFAEFFKSNKDFYETESQKFLSGTYSQIDLNWFAPFVNPDNLRCIYTPSTSRNNYSATVNGAIVYCGISGSGGAIVHEYCHSFANPVAWNWYEENAEFKKRCDETVNPEKLPTYDNGLVIAGEYVTRAYNTLYYAEHGYSPAQYLQEEEECGFPYIKDVYAMITDYKRPEASALPAERSGLGVS